MTDFPRDVRRLNRPHAEPSAIDLALRERIAAMTRQTIPFAVAFTAADDARATGASGELSNAEMVSGGFYRLILAVESAIDALRGRAAGPSDTCRA